jgi:peptide/nickel transport system substrate-binding protein
MKELKWTCVTKQLFIYLFLIVFISTFATFIPEPLKAETPKYGGVLKIITRTTPKILGYPPRITGGSYSAAYSCLESLIALDKEGHIKPVLATGWEIGPGQKSITFTLRKGVKFHDGTDFNAEAVKWNMPLTGSR